MDLPSGFSLSMPGGGWRVTHDPCGRYGGAVPMAGWEDEIRAWVEGHECDDEKTPNPKAEGLIVSPDEGDV